MAKVSYANLKLKVDNSVTKIKFNDNEIELLNYLPIEDKYDLVMITLQNSKENGIYNPIKIDMYFHLYLIYMYTNLSFTDKQREDESKLYDCLKSNGLISLILENIKEEEYNDLITFLEEQIENEMKYTTTAASVLNKFVNDLPAQAEAALKIVDNFDPEKFSAVKNFAEAANGNRPIK
ncbi:MAG: hypothetical protein ACI4PE_03170 [Bacilli bacterium]